MPTSESAPGRLVLAGTPIGHIGDATPRLCDLLSTADVIAAEDTRRTRQLAASLGLDVRGHFVSFYDHVEQARIPALLADIEAGKTVALVTDAGMPSLSDPGYRLVAACVEAGLPVTCLPGPSAVTTALALSGLPVDRFCFEGFPPRKSGQRRSWFGALAAEPRAIVFFEAPHRIADCLADAAEVLGGGRRAAVCRELTKTYEEAKRGTLSELAEWAAGGVRGEITVVLEGQTTPVEVSIEDLVGKVDDLVESGVRLKDACGQIATGSVSKRELYEAVLEARRE